MSPIGGYGTQDVQPPGGHVRIRFRSNTTYGGVDYGPSYPERVADVVLHWARQFVAMGRAEYVREELAEVEAPTAPVDLQVDPARRPGLRPIPETFPGYRALVAAGVVAIEDLAGIEDLTSIRGIGMATARAIREELGLKKNGQR